MLNWCTLKVNRIMLWCEFVLACCNTLIMMNCMCVWSILLYYCICCFYVCRFYASLWYNMVMQGWCNTSCLCILFYISLVSNVWCWIEHNLTWSWCMLMYVWMDGWCFYSQHVFLMYDDGLSTTCISILHYMYYVLKMCFWCVLNMCYSMCIGKILK